MPFLLNGFHRYFEGQFTQLSEVETEDTLETPQVNVTEAAQEVIIFDLTLQFVL